MELSKKTILRTIFEVVDEVNKMLPEERRLQKLSDTFLAGDRGNLDSLGLINFIVELESGLQKDFGLTINLFESLEMPEEPMKSIDRLAGFIHSRAKGEGI